MSNKMAKIKEKTTKPDLSGCDNCKNIPNSNIIKADS